MERTPVMTVHMSTVSTQKEAMNVFVNQVTQEMESLASLFQVIILIERGRVSVSLPNVLPSGVHALQTY